mgnify:CR=1 FL=1
MVKNVPNFRVSVILVAIAISIPHKKAARNSLIFPENKKVKNPAPIQLPATFIKNEYACGIGVQELAEHLNVNRSYLYTIFMNELHISPKDFLQKYRITRARELLVLTELSVESIGKSCGYGNAERFARAFKHETGLTPTQFRRQDRSKNRRNLEVSEDGLEKLINS